MHEKDTERKTKRQKFPNKIEKLPFFVFYFQTLVL